MTRLHFSLYATLLFAGVLCASQSAFAVPSDAQTKRDLTHAGTISVKLHGRGVRSWSSAYTQYFWERTATILRKANIPEYPKATLEIYGTARYTLVGGGTRFREFLVTDNRYYGIPTPGQGEILKMVNDDLPKFLGRHYNSIVGDLTPIKFPAKANWNWHTPNSVSFNLVTTFTEPINSTQTEKKSATFEVRIYRDSIKGKWNRFLSFDKDSVSLGKSTHDADDLKAMNTLADLDAESHAKAQMSSLPAVQIPNFKTDLEAFAYLNNALREENAPKVEAILRTMLGSPYRSDKNPLLLDNRGEDLVGDVIKIAFKGKSTYAEQYAADLNVKHYQAGMLQFWNADGRHFSRIQVALEGGEWKDGAKVNQKFKITAFEIWTASNKDEIARLRSMSPEQRFALPPQAKKFSSLSAKLQSAAAEDNR